MFLLRVTSDARMRVADELTDHGLTELDAQVAAEIDRAVAAAERADLEPVADLERFVYSERG